MLPIHEDLIGWRDMRTGEVITAGDAEWRWGAKIYRDGERPEFLSPIFRSTPLPKGDDDAV